MPVNVLIFCGELDLTEENMSAKLSDTKFTKKEITVELNTEKLNLGGIIDLFTNSGAIKLYKEQEIQNKTIYCGTQFEHKTAKSQAIIIIDVKNPVKTKIEVHGDKAQFQDCILKDLIDVLSK